MIWMQILWTATWDHLHVPSQWRFRPASQSVQSGQALLRLLWVDIDLSFLQAENEDSNQTMQMNSWSELQIRRAIWNVLILISAWKRMLWVIIWKGPCKKYVVGTHYKHLTEALLTSAYNIHFCVEIKKKPSNVSEFSVFLLLWLLRKGQSHQNLTNSLLCLNYISMKIW